MKKMKWVFATNLSFLIHLSQKYFELIDNFILQNSSKVYDVGLQKYSDKKISTAEA